MKEPRRTRRGAKQWRVKGNPWCFGRFSRLFVSFAVDFRKFWTLDGMRFPHERVESLAETLHYPSPPWGKFLKNKPGTKASARWIRGNRARNYAQPYSNDRVSGRLAQPVPRRTSSLRRHRNACRVTREEPTPLFPNLPFRPFASSPSVRPHWSAVGVRGRNRNP